MSSDSFKPSKSKIKIVAPPAIAESDSLEQKVDIVSEVELKKSKTALICAPVWRRGLAALVDEIGIYLLANIPTVIALYAVVYVIRSGIRPTLSSDFEAAMKGSGSPMTLFFYLMATVVIFLFMPTVRLLYFAVFESSRSQASPGKRLLGLKVVNAHGDRFRFWPCFWKALLQSVLCALCVGPPVLLAMTIGLPQVYGMALLIAGFVAYLLLCYGVIAFNKERQTLLDKLMRRFVVHTTSQEQNQKAAPDFTHKAFWCTMVLGVVGYSGLNLLHGGRLMTELSPRITPNFSGVSVVAKKDIAPGTIGSAADFELQNTGRFFTPISTVADVSNVQGALILFRIPGGTMVHQDTISTKFGAITSISSSRKLTAQENYSYRMKRLDQELERCEKSDFGWDTAYASRAWIHNEHGDYKAAIEDCKLAIAKSKYDLAGLESEVHLNQARAFAGLHSYTSAKNALAKVDFEDSSIQKSIAYAVRANIYRHDRKFKLAAADEKRAEQLRRDEEAMQLSRQAVQCSFDPAEREIALELWREALNLSALPSLYRDRAKYYAKDPDDLQAALKDATAAIEHSRGQPSELNASYSARAYVYEELGDKRAAEQDRSKIDSGAESGDN